MCSSDLGNNSAYCQDELAWLDWELEGWQRDLTSWVTALLALRRAHPVLRHRHFLEGRPAYEGGRKDLAWFRPDGNELDDHDWFARDTVTLGMYLSGDGLRARTADGRRLRDDSFLLVVHAGAADVEVTLPPGSWAEGWATVLDSADEQPGATNSAHRPGDRVLLGPRSALLLRATGGS